MAKRMPGRSANRPEADDHASQLPSDLVQELQRLAIHLKGKVIGRRIWKELLTPHEQALLSLKEFLASHPADVYACMRRISRDRAVLDLSHELELVSDQQYRRFLRKLKMADLHHPDRPVWNDDRLELMLRGQVVRRIRSRSHARNVVRILDAFQDLDWPARIHDPLPGGADDERLRDTVKSLNRGLVGLKFRADGTGCGVVWELA